MRITRCQVPDGHPVSFNVVWKLIAMYGNGIWDMWWTDCAYTQPHSGFTRLGFISRLSWIMQLYLQLNLGLQNMVLHKVNTEHFLNIYLIIYIYYNMYESIYVCIYQCIYVFMYVCEYIHKDFLYHSKKLTRFMFYFTAFGLFSHYQITQWCPCPLSPMIRL